MCVKIYNKICDIKQLNIIKFCKVLFKWMEPSHILQFTGVFRFEGIIVSILRLFVLYNLHASLIWLNMFVLHS